MTLVEAPSQYEVPWGWELSYHTTLVETPNEFEEAFLKVPDIQSSNYRAHVGLLSWWMCLKKVVCGENVIPFSGTTLSQIKHLLTSTISSETSIGQYKHETRM